LDDGARRTLSGAIEAVDQLISEYDLPNDNEDKKYDFDRAVTSRAQAATAPGRRIFDDLDA
jgi:hypothetical protein